MWQLLLRLISWKKLLWNFTRSQLFCRSWQDCWTDYFFSLVSWSAWSRWGRTSRTRSREPWSWWNTFQRKLYMEMCVIFDWRIYLFHVRTSHESIWSRIFTLARWCKLYNFFMPREGRYFALKKTMVNHSYFIQFKPMLFLISVPPNILQEIL